MLRERRRHASFKPNRKLDRKSSRGMIYENEELRIRTININAEVERGQSDIKKLRRENYQLRKEIWTLRDEHDRLGKLLRSRNCDAGGSSSYVVAGDSDDEEKITIDDDADDYDYEYDDDFRCCSCHSNEDDISCDICNEGEIDATSAQTDSTNELTMNIFTANTQRSSPTSGAASVNATDASTASTSSILKSSLRPEKMDIQFDHLSVVSEECLSNSDDQIEQQKRMLTQSDVNDSSPLPSMTLNDADDFIPEKSASAIYADFQSSVPTLAHFENLSYKDIGPNVDSLGELHYNSESTPTTGETIIPTLGWDFTLHQPLKLTAEGVVPVPSTSSISSKGAATMTESEAASTTKIFEKDFTSPMVKNFFAPLKTKTMRHENSNQNELRPDLCIGNVLACDTNKLATIRRPHNPLKCPISQQSDHDYANVSHLMPSSTQSDAALDNILHDIEDLSKDIEHMQFHNNRIYEGGGIDEMQQPYRTEMSVVLSYNGNQKKVIERQELSSIPRVDSCIATDGTVTPTQTLPRAMKLLPNTLSYVKKDASTPPTSRSNPNQDAMERENDENAAVQDANVETTTKNVNFKPTTDKSDESAKDILTKCTKNTSTMASMRKHFFGRRSSVGKIKRKDSITDAIHAERDIEITIDEKETIECSDSCIADNVDPNSTSNEKSSDALKRTKSTRRVSVNFNGKSNGAGINESSSTNELTQLDAPSTQSNEIDEIKQTPILCSRRHHSISSRQDSIGSIVYPSSPFFARRASKRSVLSRRHSDGLIPFAQRNQYFPHLEYGGSHATKHTTNRHHHHHHSHGHSHYHHHTVPFKEPESLQDMLGTCNSLASSRESSTSLSQRSTSQQQKRKISITSHSQGGGKIPWCACWGNGCI